jgi:protoheme IX farnesyltransferase
MPPVLGWAAARGRLDFEALVLFVIVFFWQYPHFHSIAWLYREDYKRADIRMLPVVEANGRSTVREIVFYLIALVRTSFVPSLIGMAGRIYLFGAFLLGAGFFWAGWQLASARMSPENAESRRLARHLLQASVIYLPLLFALMMINAAVL